MNNFIRANDRANDRANERANKRVNDLLREKDFIALCKTCDKDINTDKESAYEICQKCHGVHHRSCLKIMCHVCGAVYCPACSEGWTMCLDCGEPIN